MSQVSLEKMKKGLQCSTWVSQPVYLSNTFLIRHAFRWCTIVGFCIVALCQDLLPYVHFFKIHIIFRQETELRDTLFHSSHRLMDWQCLQQDVSEWMYFIYFAWSKNEWQGTSHLGFTCRKILYAPTCNLLTFDFQKQKQWHESNCWKAEHWSL